MNWCHKLMKNNNLIDVLEEADELYIKVSSNVKKLRKKYKLSQLDFSSSVGFNSVSFYCDCENNKNGKHFNLLHVVRIAEYFEISVDELIK